WLLRLCSGLLRGLKLERAPRRSSARPRDGSHGFEAHPWDRPQVWNEYARGETAGADRANSHFISDWVSCGHHVGDSLLGHSRCAVVFQDCRVEAALQVSVSLGAIVDSVLMLEERVDVYLSC